MKKIIEYGALIAFGLLLIYVMVSRNRLKEENELYKNKIENDYKLKLKELQLQLERSRRERMVLIDSFNRRSVYIETLVSDVDSLEKELKSVKGRYKKLTSSEKANELTRRAYDSK